MSETIAKCPVCQADIEWDDELTEGDFIDCGQCGSSLEVLGIEPVTLSPDDDDEDVDNDDDEDDDDDEDFEDDDYEDDDED